MLSPEYTSRSRHCTAPHHRALPWRASPWKRCEEVHFTLAAEFLSDFFLRLSVLFCFFLMVVVGVGVVDNFTLVSVGQHARPPCGGRIFALYHRPVVCSRLEFSM